MKKFYGIMGAICSIIGLVMTLSAQAVISTNTRYTWSPPYSQFELQHLSLKWIGILLLVSGIIDIAMVVISKIYTDKNVRDTSVQEYSIIICPSCGLRLSKSAEICPKCKIDIRKGEISGKNNN